AGEGDTSQGRLWEVASGREQSGLGAGVTSIVFAPDSRSLALVQTDSSVRLLDIGTGKEQHWAVNLGSLRDLESNFHTAEQGGGWPVAFSPDGRTLVGAARLGPLPRWDMTTGKELPPPGPRPGLSTSLGVSPDGTTLAAGGPEGVALWDVRTGALLR